MIHLCPEGDGDSTQCCQVRVIDLPSKDRLTVDGSLVTCRDLLKEAVAAFAIAGPEIHQQDALSALWALYDCLFSVLEHLGADGLPRKESEGAERG